LDAPLQSNPTVTEMPKDCPAQVGPAASRSPHKRLNEKASSVHNLFKSTGVSTRKSPTRGISRSSSAADLNPMASSLPQRILQSESQANQNTTISTSSEYMHLSPRSKQKVFAQLILSALAPKTAEASPLSVTSSQPAAAAETKAFPPMTVCRASLAEARWDSSRSLNDSPPKLPTEETAAEVSLLSAASSHSASVAETKTLPPMTVCRALLSEARWDSSRSLNDSPPKLPAEDDKSNNHSLNVDDKAPQTTRKSAEVNPPSTVSSQPAAVAETKTLPPMTVCRALLSEARWDSSRSLNDSPPKLPTEEGDSSDDSQNVDDKAPRTPRKSAEVSPLNAATETKALPPTTVCRALLAEARWDSSRSLNDCNVEDKAPRSPRKAPQENTPPKA
jgi:hypothetical protein